MNYFCNEILENLEMGKYVLPFFTYPVCLHYRYRYFKHFPTYFLVLHVCENSYIPENDRFYLKFKITLIISFRKVLIRYTLLSPTFVNLSSNYTNFTLICESRCTPTPISFRTP